MFKKISSFWEMIFGPSDEENAGDLKLHTYKKKGLTPTFFDIARDLSSKQDQVFEASVYNLCVIAKAKVEYQNEILKILSDYLVKRPKETKRAEYIKNTLSAFSLDEFLHN
ncbi:MAG TPA: hypothetical protein DIC64_01360 [Alphaproteobacteria bacterium]|nr:hypothetical protein [Alphaproteobacteria bacterium]